MQYTEKLKKSIARSNSCLCVGLDPNLERIPAPLKSQFGDGTNGREELVIEFLKQVIEATREHCAAYKPNLGFFEALGENGLKVFQRVLDLIPSGHIIIADAKRGDISSTAQHYAKAYFEVFDADAVTVNPLMGFESLDPFLEYPSKAVYTLALTSNPGAKDFLMKPFGSDDTVAAFIAGKLARLQPHSDTELGMVVGATKTSILPSVIKHHPNAPLLIPGIGTQGGTVEELQKAIARHAGISLINSSRSILYAGSDQENWAQAVEDQAREFKKKLHSITENYV